VPKRQREGAERRLGRAVDRHARQRGKRQPRRDVHDEWTLLGQEVRDEEPGQVERRLKIDGDLLARFVPFLRRGKSHPLLDPGIVDEHVEAGKFRHHPVKQRLALSGLGQIADPDGEPRMAGLRFAEFVRPATAHDDLAARPEEPLGQREADARRPTGDQDGVPTQVHDCPLLDPAPYLATALLSAAPWRPRSEHLGNSRASSRSGLARNEAAPSGIFPRRDGRVKFSAAQESEKFSGADRGPQATHVSSRNSWKVSAGREQIMKQPAIELLQNNMLQTIWKDRPAASHNSVGCSGVGTEPHAKGGRS